MLKANIDLPLPFPPTFNDVKDRATVLKYLKIKTQDLQAEFNPANNAVVLHTQSCEGKLCVLWYKTLKNIHDALWACHWDICISLPVQTSSPSLGEHTPLLQPVCYHTKT